MNDSSANKARARKSALGSLLRHHRMAAGLSQETLAERATLSVCAISALERGQRRYPYDETLALLVSALELTTADAAVLKAAAARPKHPRAHVGPELADKRYDAPDVVLSTDPDGLPDETTSLGRRRQLVTGRVPCLRRGRLVMTTGVGGVGETRRAWRVAPVKSPKRNRTYLAWWS